MYVSNIIVSLPTPAAKINDDDDDDPDLPNSHAFVSCFRLAALIVKEVTRSNLGLNKK